MVAVQESATSIRVSWSPSSDATGYIISYTDGDSSVSVTVSDGSTDNYLLTGLQNGVTYSIAIIATSHYFHSDSVTTKSSLGEQKFYVCFF